MFTHNDRDGGRDGKQFQKLRIPSLKKRRLKNYLKTTKDSYVDEELNVFYVGLESKNRTD